jgi:hypothetical protein
MEIMRAGETGIVVALWGGWEGKSLEFKNAAGRAIPAERWSTKVLVVVRNRESLLVASGFFCF